MHFENCLLESAKKIIHIILITPMFSEPSRMCDLPSEVLKTNFWWDLFSPVYLKIEHFNPQLMYPQKHVWTTLLHSQSDLVKVPLLLCRQGEWHGLSDGFQGPAVSKCLLWMGLENRRFYIDMVFSSYSVKPYEIAHDSKSPCLKDIP